MPVKSTATPSTFYKHPRSSGHTSAQAVNPVALARFIGGDKWGSMFIYSGMYCLVCYSRSHVTSECRHFKQDDQFVRASCRNYKIRIRKHVDRQSQMDYPVTHRSALFLKCPALQGKCSKNSNRCSNTQYPSRQIPKSNWAYSNLPFNCFSNIAALSKTLSYSEFNQLKMMTNGVKVIACGSFNNLTSATVRISAMMRN